jgi:hypothetical protein
MCYVCHAELIGYGTELQNRFSGEQTVSMDSIMQLWLHQEGKYEVGLFVLR